MSDTGKENAMRSRVDRVVRACVVVALGAVVMATGCEDRGVTSSAPPKQVVKSADVTESSRQGRSNLYGPGNPYALSVVDEVVARAGVARVLERLEERGLELAYEECFVLEQERPGGVVSATMLVMTPAREGVEETAMIACIDNGGEFVVAPATFRPSGAARAEGFEHVGDGVWMNGDPLGGAHRSSADAERLDPELWSRFWNCLMVGAPTAFAGCAMSCTFVVMSYPQCVVVCVASQSLATFVRCLMSTWLISGGVDATRS
jgi:hypothetical protein